jgi:uncharacterized protein (TIGR02996 family)
VGQDREFIGAILERPEDDAPRLIYADWLEERGRHERAELIRLQLDRRVADPGDPERAARERELVRVAEGQLEEELPLRGVVLWGGIERGLVARAIWPDVESFVEQAGEMWEAAPVTRIGFLRLRPDDFPLLERSPWFGRIRELDLGRHPGLGPAAAEWLAGPGPEIGLTGLRLDAAKLGDDSAGLLARSRRLPALEGLDLSLNRVGDPGLGALAASEAFPALRRLHLGRNPLGKPGIKALADSAAFPLLRELWLNETGLTLDAALALAEARGLPALERLYLGRNRLSEHAIGPLRARFGDRLVTE